MPTVFGYTSSPAVGEELVSVVSQERPDLVVIDAMFSSALAVAPRFGVPAVVMLHTFLERVIDGWRPNFAMQSGAREQAGFSGLPDLDALSGQRELLQVNTLAALDAPRSTAWANVNYGAPVLAAESRAVPVGLPWALADSTPLVLLSFSTVPEQRSVDTLQRALVALAELPVHVIATTGGIVDPAELRAGGNAHLVDFADHDQLMARPLSCSAMEDMERRCGRFGTGVPIVGMPARGADQAPITQLLEELKVGRALPGDASVLDLRSAVNEVLTVASYSEEAGHIADLFGDRDGAALAADSVQTVPLP